MANQDVAENLNILGQIILEIMRESVKDLWKKEDTEFLKQLAQDVAEQRIAIIQSKDQESKTEHVQNLRHLANTVELEIVNRRLKLRAFRKETFVRILQAIIKTVAATALEVVESKVAR